jgi:hypothetical protein
MPARLTPVPEDKFVFGLWDGPGNGTWEIAANSMKTYLAFAVKARAFDADPAVQQATELAGQKSRWEVLNGGRTCAQSRKV